MSSHTPGPWHVVEFDGFFGIRGGSDNIFLAETDGGEPDDLANANLIAAAPDLLAVCERLAKISHIDQLDDVMVAAIAVIDKAKQGTSAKRA